MSSSSSPSRERRVTATRFYFENAFCFFDNCQESFFALVVVFTVINGVAAVAFMVVVVAADDAVLLSLPSS